MRIVLSLTPKQVAEILNALDIAESDYAGDRQGKTRRYIAATRAAVVRQLKRGRVTP